jgi:hypothetical protein
MGRIREEAEAVNVVIFRELERLWTGATGVIVDEEQSWLIGSSQEVCR